MKSILAVFMALVLTFSLVGCGSTSQLVTALNAVADASSVAVVLTETLAGTGKIDPAVATQVANYAQGVTTAVQESIAELSSADTNPVKITKITADFAAVAAPAFGPGTSPQIQAAIQAVSAAVQLFLNQLHQPTVLTLAKVSPVKAVKLSVGDKSALKSINKKAAAVFQHAAKLKAAK